MDYGERLEVKIRVKVVPNSKIEGVIKEGDGFWCGSRNLLKKVKPTEQLSNCWRTTLEFHRGR